MAALLPLDLAGGANVLTTDFTVGETFASRFLVLPNGPFFTKGTFVRDLSTNKMLRPWIDYKLVHLDNTLSHATKQEICSVVYIRNMQVKNVRVVTAATGGWDNSEVAALKANLATWIPKFDEHIGWAQHMDREVQAHPIIHLSRAEGDDEWLMETAEMQMQFLRQTIQDGDSALSAHIMSWLEYTYAEVEAQLGPMKDEIDKLLDDALARNQKGIGEFVFTDNIDNSLLNKPGFWEEYNNTSLQDVGDGKIGYHRAMKDGDFVRVHATELFQRVEALESANFKMVMKQTFVNEGETLTCDIYREAGDGAKFINIDVISKQRGRLHTWNRVIANGSKITLSYGIGMDYNTNGDDVVTFRIREHPGFYAYAGIRDTSHTVDWDMQVITRNSKHVSEAGGTSSTPLVDVTVTRSYAAFNTIMYLHVEGDVVQADLVSPKTINVLNFDGDITNILTTIEFKQDDLNDEGSEKAIIRLSKSADPKNTSSIIKEVVFYVSDAPKLTHTQLRWSSRADGKDTITWCAEGDVVYLIGQLGHDIDYNPSIPPLIVEDESLAQSPDDYILIEPPTRIDGSTVAWRCQTKLDGIRDSHPFEVLTVRTGISNTARLFIKDISYPINVKMKWTANPNRYADQIGVASEDMLFFLHIETDTVPPGSIANISLDTASGDQFATAVFDETISVFNDYARVMFKIDADYTYTGDKNLVARFSVGGQDYSSPIIRILDTTLPFVDLRFTDENENVITEVKEGDKFKIQAYNHSMTRTAIPSITVFENSATTVTPKDFVGAPDKLIDASKWGITRKWIDIQPGNYITVAADGLTEGDEVLQVRVKFPDTLEGGQIVPTGLESVFTLAVRDSSLNPTFEAYIAKTVGGSPLTLINEGEAYYYVVKPVAGASIMSVSGISVGDSPNANETFVPSSEVSADVADYFPASTVVNGVTLPAGSVVQRFLIQKIYRDDGIRKFGRGANVTMVDGQTHQTGNVVVNVDDTFQQPKVESLTFSSENGSNIFAANEGDEVTVHVTFNTYMAPGTYTLEIVDSSGVVIKAEHKRDVIPKDTVVHDGSTNYLIRTMKFLFAENYRTDGDREIYARVKYTPTTAGAFTAVNYLSKQFTIVDSSTEPQVLGGWVRSDDEFSDTIIEVNEGETIYLRFALVNVKAGETFVVSMRGGAGITANDYRILGDTTINSTGSNIYWHYIPVEITADMQTEGIENLIAVLNHTGSDFEAIYPINIGDTSRGVEVILHTTGEANDVLHFNAKDGKVDFTTTSLDGSTPYRYYLRYLGVEYTLLDYTTGTVLSEGEGIPSGLFIPTLAKTVQAEVYLDYTYNGNKRTLAFGERTLINQMSVQLVVKDAATEIWNGGYTFDPYLKLTGDLDQEVTFKLTTYRDAKRTVKTTSNTLGTSANDSIQKRSGYAFNTGDVHWVNIVPPANSFNEYSNNIYLTVEMTIGTGSNLKLLGKLEDQIYIPNFMGGASKSSTVVSENVYGYVETTEYYLSTLDTSTINIFGIKGQTVRFWVEDTFGLDVSSNTPLSQPYVYTIPATGVNVVTLPWNLTDLTLQEKIVNPMAYVKLEAEMINHETDETSTILNHFRMPVYRPWNINVTLRDDFAKGNLFTLDVVSTVKPYHPMVMESVKLWGNEVSWIGIPAFATPQTLNIGTTRIGTISGFEKYVDYTYLASMISLTGTTANPAPYAVSTNFSESFFDDLININASYIRGTTIEPLFAEDGRTINTSNTLELDRYYNLTISYDKLPANHKYRLHVVNSNTGAIISYMNGLSLDSTGVKGTFTFPVAFTTSLFEDYVDVKLYLVDETSKVRWYGTKVTLVQNTVNASINFYTDAAMTKLVGPNNRPYSGNKVYMSVVTENVADGEKVNIRWEEISDFAPTDFVGGTLPETVIISSGVYQTTLTLI